MKIMEINAKHALGKSGMSELNYAFNPYLGCFHGCRYCYAIDMSPNETANDWGNIVYVRNNIIPLLQREARTYRKGIVGISTITDPYQAAEMKYRIIPQAIEILAKNGFYITLQTKSPLILKDIEILKKYKKNLDAGITVTALDKRISNLLEPHAPDPYKRLQALKKLKDNEINSWLYLGPIVHGVNDDIEGISKIIEFCGKNEIRIIYDSYQDFKGTIPYMSNTHYIKTDDLWWNGMVASIKVLCRENNVICTLEKDEWEYEAKERYKTLF